MTWEAVVTNNGIGLLKESLAGKKLTMTGADGGTGTVPAASMMTQTQLVDKKQTLSLVGLNDTENGKQLKIQITSAGVTTGYKLNQVGVYASLEGSEPVLFALLQDSDGVDIPSATDLPEFLMEFYALVEYSQYADIVVNLDPAAGVSLGTLEERLATKEEVIKKAAEVKSISADELIVLSVGGETKRILYEDFMAAEKRYFDTIYRTDEQVKNTVKNMLPTKVSDLENDAGYLNEHQDISGKQESITAPGILKGDGSGNVVSAIPGTDYGYPQLRGSIDPTHETVGAAGQHYLNTETGKEFVCTHAGERYTWELANAHDASDIAYNSRTVQAAISDLERICVKTFGVSWDYTNPSTELTRLTRATDPNFYVTVDVTEEPVPATADGAGGSPFDNYMPWSSMEEYNVVDGAISYPRGHSQFSRTAYDTVVRIPKYYYRVEKDESNHVMRFYISDGPRAGFAVHPAFSRGDGKERDSIYVGKYSDIAGYYSKSGAVPLTSITRPEARIGSTAKGPGWYQYDYAAWCAVWLLYLVEFADWDTQTKVGWGNVGSGVTKNTGGTDVMTYHTGKAYDDSAEAENGVYGAQVQYRHIEDPWGNVQNWVDGINFYERLAYICLDPLFFADDTQEHYISTGLTLPTSNGLISGIGYSEDFPYAFVPSAFGGEEFSYIPDYANSADGWRVLRVGGFRTCDSYAGLFCFYSSYASSASFVTIGARLLFLP